MVASALASQRELAPLDLLKAAVVAPRGDLAGDGGVHGADNAEELGRLSGRQQKGGGSPCR